MSRKMFAFALVGVMALSACTESGEIDPSVSSLIDNGTTEAADAIESAISEMNNELNGPEIPAEVTAAWNDLSQDLSSMVTDLVADPESADFDAMVSRMESFGTTLGDLTSTPSVQNAWDRLLDSMKSMQDALS